MVNELEYRNRIIKLGLNISYHRRFRNLSQEQLAEKAGISRQYLAKIEAPDMIKSFSFKTLFKIADALDIPPHKLVEFRDE